MSHRVLFNSTITLDERELEVEVVAEVQPAIPEGRTQFGWDPPEPTSVEILSVVDEDSGQHVIPDALTEHDQQALKEKAAEEDRDASLQLAADMDFWKDERRG